MVLQHVHTMQHHCTLLAFVVLNMVDIHCSFATIASDLIRSGAVRCAYLHWVITSVSLCVRTG